MNNTELLAMRLADLDEKDVEALLLIMFGMQLEKGREPNALKFKTAVRN